MRKASKKILSLALAMAMALLPVTALAATDPIEYLVCDADGTNWRTETINLSDITQITNSTTTLNGSTTGGWYYVEGDVATTGLIVSGDVHLILLNGCTLTATGTATTGAGIRVSGTNSLTIYAQSADPGTMGVLTATATSRGAGIGGGFGVGSSVDGGTITINGGTVNATGHYGGAGIGGCLSGKNGGNGGIITINGGTVNATGGENGGAGIGGSVRDASPGGGGGTITINGGTVNATGHYGGAGIGGGEGGNGGVVTISGDTTVVNATGGDSANDVGGGNGGSGGSLEVSGGATLNLNKKGTNAVLPNFEDCTIGGSGAGNLAGTYDSSGNKLVTGVTLNKTNLTLTVGGSETLIATVLPSDADNTDVTWSSDNSSVATVDQSGKVTAVSAGTANISVTADDGSNKSASCAVTVNSGSSGGGYIPPPQLIHGFNGGVNTYTQGSGQSLVHTTQKDFSYFSYVRMDGKTLTRDTDYKAGSGSTVITLYADYLDTLSTGKHTLGVYFKDGVTVTAEFTIEEAVTPKPQPWVNPFEDVKESDWYYGDVEYVYTNGLMTGTSASPMLFSPQTLITRGMIVTILYRAEGSPEVSTERSSGTYFTDVDQSAWYAAAVAWAAENGIANGYGDLLYGPEDDITRQDLAVILWRYAKYAGMDVSVGENTNILSYNDVFDVAEYAIPAMQWACGAGVVGGKPGGLLDPRGTATRAETAAMLHRFLGAEESN